MLGLFLLPNAQPAAGPPAAGSGHGLRGSHGDRWPRLGGAKKEAHPRINDHALTRDTLTLQNSESLLKEPNDLPTTSEMGMSARVMWLGPCKERMPMSRRDNSASAEYIAEWGSRECHSGTPHHVGERRSVPRVGTYRRRREHRAHGDAHYWCKAFDLYVDRDSDEVGLLATAPTSMTSALASSRLSASEMAAWGTRKRPPSENEISVMLTMPSSLANACHCCPPGAHTVCNYPELDLGNL